MLRLALAVTLALALPASASAAPLGELPPLDVKGEASCVQVTGTPGELSMPTADGVRFVQATRTGFQRGQNVKLGLQFSCGAIATRPGGAGVIAGFAAGGRLVAAFRDPGGAWSAPVALTDPADDRFASELVAAVSERGDTIVAWQAQQPTETSRYSLHVARRAPGAGFKPSEQIGTTSQRRSGFKAAIAATGEAFMLIATGTGQRATSVSVATAPADGAFGPPTAIGSARWLSGPSLDVAPDGRALIALADATAVRVAEREPGGAAFGPATPVAPAASLLSAPSVRLTAGGAAAITWQNVFNGAGWIVTRGAPGPFSAPMVTSESVAPTGSDPFYASEAYYTNLFGTASESSDIVLTSTEQSVAFTADGRAVLSLVHTDTRGFLTPQLGTIPLAGGPLTTSAAAPRFGTTFGTASMLLADGTPAVMWWQLSTNLLESALEPRLRVRVAAEGVTVPIDDPPVPKVTIGAPRDTRLGLDDPLILPVTCSAACEVTAMIDSNNPILGLSDTVHLRKAGHGELTLDGAAVVADGRVRIRVASGAPGATHPRVRTITRRVTRSVPLPSIASVRARRVGDRVRVTFRTKDLDEDDFPIFVSGEDTRGYNGEPLSTRVVMLDKGESARTVTLPAADVQYVAVRMPFDFGPGSKLVVRVR